MSTLDIPLPRITGEGSEYAAQCSGHSNRLCSYHTLEYSHAFDCETITAQADRQPLLWALLRLLAHQVPALAAALTAAEVAAEDSVTEAPREVAAEPIDDAHSRPTPRHVLPDTSPPNTAV